MKLWLISFAMLFGAVELYQWIFQVSGFSDAQLSLPVALAGGIILAIASNYDGISGLPFNPACDRSAQSDRLSANPSISLQTANKPNEPCKGPISFQILTPPKPSISFEIQKPSDRRNGH